MDIITLLLIAFGLSFDTFAVSVSVGIILLQIKFRQALKVAIILAVFQALMPIIGWLLGRQVERLLTAYDHWIAFIVLLLLGVKMIHESFGPEEKRNSLNPMKMNILVGMAIATSIDALVVGFSFAFIKMNIYWSVFVIGVITFLVSMTGILFGKKVGNRLGKKMEVVGGLILIGIGVKILMEHLYF